MTACMYWLFSGYLARGTSNISPHEGDEEEDLGLTPALRRGDEEEDFGLTPALGRGEREEGLSLTPALGRGKRTLV